MQLAFDHQEAEAEEAVIAAVEEPLELPDRRKDVWEDGHKRTVVEYKPGVAEGSEVLHYQIGYLEMENKKLRGYMCRGDDDEAYLDFLVDGTKEMPFFPYIFPKRDGVTHQSDYVLCASVCMTFRVRRLLLTDEISELQAKLQEYHDLKDLCEKKKCAHADRVIMLEGEMDHMVEEIKEKTHDPRDMHPFSALIQNKEANKLLCDFLAREAKRLQAETEMHLGEEVDEDMDLEKVVDMWELLQYYTIVNSIRVRAKNGNKHYPVNGRADSTKVVVKGRQPGSAPVSARSTDSNKGGRGKSPESLKPGDMKKLKAASKKGATAKTDSTGVMDNDDSTIASGTSLGNLSGTSKSVASAAKEPEQPKKSGGWGFSAMANWVSGKKEEVVVEDDGPKELKLVPFTVSGNGMGACDWLDIAVCMGNKRGDQTLKSACKGFLELLKMHAGEGEEGEDGMGVLECIPKVCRNDFIMGLNELGVKEMSSPIVEAAAAQMVTILAEELHKRIMGALRLHDKWCAFLEGFRKDRIRRSGGSLKEDNEGQVEVDKQGTIRIIPNSDKIVDTDIVHGSKQRLQISVVEPVLFQKLGEATEKLQVLLGELACVVQFGYIYVAPYVQRAIRRSLSRMHKNTSRRDVGLYAMHGAATTIQTWLRGKWGKRAYAIRKAELMGNLFEDITIFVQKYARMGTQRIPYLKRKRAKAAASEWFAVTKFQAMIRGFNARHKYTKFKATVHAEREKETKFFSVGLLQRWARGCIARRTIVKSLKVRKTIDKDILLKAEKYLEKGDLWSFLKQINDDMMILKKTIDDNQKTEDEFASTFVNKVIMRRQGEFDGAWDKFSDAVKGSDGASSVGPRAMEDGVLSAAGQGGNQALGMPVSMPGGPPTEGTAPLVSKSLDTGAKAKGLQTDATGRPLSPTRAGESIPGPMLRRAVSATVQDGVSREMRSQSRGGGGGESERKGGASVKSTASSKKTGGTTGGSSKKGASGKKGSTKAGKKAPSKGKNKKMTAEEEQEKGKAYATTTDWAWAQATGTEAAEEKKKKEIIQEPHIGESLLIDIPKGIDDTMERLIHAASLKCFIPEFSNCETSEQAYDLYLQLPSGLAKMRYEVEARRWTQPMINKLRVKGVINIADALPMNKFKQYVDSVALPVNVQLMTAKWVRILKDMGPLVHGKPHAATAEAQKQLKSGKGTVGQLAKVSLKHKKTSALLGTNEDEEDGGSPSRPGGGGDGAKHAPGWTVKDGAGPAGTPSEQLSMTKSGGATGGRSLNDPNSIDLGETAEQKAKREADTAVVQALLDDFVSKGTWANLQASAEDFLLHAAFIIVAHPIKDAYGNDVGHTEMGQGGFKAHMHELSSTDDADRKRELVRNRFREALLFSTPYTLRLRALGVNTVLDILTQSEVVKTMDFPAMYETQVEALLSVAVGASASAKSAPLNKEAVKTAPEVFKVPLMFDPKFQRSPFDPYGQPPRYVPKKINDVSINDKHKSGGGGSTKTPKSTGGATQGKGKGKDTGKSATSSSTSAAVAEDGDDDLHENGLFANEEEEAKSPVTDNTKALFKLQVNEKDRSQAKEEVVLVSKEPKVERKKDFYKQDFEARVRAGFERPFKCKHPGCHEAFSRAYTLKVHEKSHKVFGNYHKWKKQPQLGLDMDKKAMAEEALNLVEERSRLPPIVVAELNKLSRLSKTFSVSSTVEELEGPKPEVFEYDPALDGTAWPERSKSMAGIALESMPDDESRPNTSTPFFPPRGMSPYLDSEPVSQMPSRAQSRGNMGSRQLASRSGSRGQSRGHSRGGMMKLEPLNHADDGADI